MKVLEEFKTGKPVMDIAVQQFRISKVKFIRNQEVYMKPMSK